MNNGIDDDKLDELGRCAEAADGPWYRLGLSVVDAPPDCDDDAGPGLVADCFPGDIDEAHSLPAHIAAADPPTVLELVREVRRLRKELQRETLTKIRDITDPNTDTAQPPMAAIREVLEADDDR